jgi:RAB protein geranylgeranyltransferase component A
VAYWVKLFYERKEYVVNFERINTFCYEKNGRVTFWLPDSAMPIVINPQNSLHDYQKILDYLEHVKGLELDNAHWVKINFDRNEYVVNLTCISSFCYEANGRITFWLPDVTIPIIINPTNNPESYQKVLQYIQQSTGYPLT